MNYEAASKEIQNIVRGACLDPEIRKKAAAAGKGGHVLDSRLGGHWAGRILAAASIEETTARIGTPARRSNEGGTA